MCKFCFEVRLTEVSHVDEFYKYETQEKLNRTDICGWIMSWFYKPQESDDYYREDIRQEHKKLNRQYDEYMAREYHRMIYSQQEFL